MEQNTNEMQAFFTGTVLEDGYGYIPRNIMRDPSLSRNAKAIYSYFMSFAGSTMTAFPSVATICKELGFGSDDTYYKYLNELKNRGLLSCKLEKNAQGKFSRNIFTMTLHKSNIENVIKSNSKEKENKLALKNKKPFHYNRDTVNEDSENRGTNINKSNINNTNILEEDEDAKKFNELLEVFKDNIDNFNVTPKSKKLEFLKSLYTLCGYEYIDKLIEHCCSYKTNNPYGYFKKTAETFIINKINTVKKLEIAIDNWQDFNLKLKEKERAIRIQRANSSGSLRSIKKDNFNNYKQREYDFDDLEKKLLGWL